MPERKNEARWVASRQRWQIKVQYDGERPTFTSSTPGTKGKIEAEKKADKWLESNIINNNIRLNKLWEDFLKEVKLLTGSSNYRKHDQMGRLWILPDLKNKRVMKITVQEWQNCINSAYKKGLSKKSCQNVRASITALYRYAKKKRIPMEKPDDLIIPKDAAVGERNIMQPSDIKKVFETDYIVKYGKQIKALYIHAFRFILLTGLRRGELCGIRSEDINDKILHIKRSINEEQEETKGKTANANRYMVISQHARAVLDDQARFLKSKGIISPWLFPDESGDCLDPNHLYKMWLSYRSQHGIKCSIHEMRHTMISVAKADVPEQLLKEAVGHSKSMDTFGVYGHNVEGEMERVANIIDDIFDTLLK